MSKPANPITYFVNGSAQESFTFEPGGTLYFAQAKTPGWVAMSVLLMADSEWHVRRILLDAAGFREYTVAKYKDYGKYSGQRGSDYERDLEKWRGIAAAVRGEPSKFELTITEAPLNQMFKTAWASNDII